MMSLDIHLKKKPVYLSILPAMGHSSVSANCLQVSFIIWCVSGSSVNVLTPKLLLMALLLLPQAVTASPALAAAVVAAIILVTASEDIGSGL